MTVTSPKPSLVMARLPQQLLGSTTFLLKRLGYAAKEQAMETYEQTGLHPYHHAVLIALGEGSHATQGSIADALGYDRGQLVGLLDELEKRGFVERRRDPEDRRRHLVDLTSDGKRTLGKLDTIARQSEDAFLDPLTAEERETLQALLRKLAEKHEPRCAPLPPPAS
jgi:MarR family transcriptional regulator, lower aerobic nicotinate degradation pathway regulator